jgi:peroxin-6
VQFPEVHQPGRRRGATETQADRIFLYSAYRSEEAEDQQAQNISLSWLPEAYDSSPVSVTVAAHSPLPLSSIILATSDTSLLDAAQDASSTFGQDIAGALVRQSEHVYLPQGRARVVQTEPILQGLITPETSILVVYDAEEASAGQSLDVASREELQETQTTGPDADFFIDERFLADSVLEDFDKQWEDDYAQEAAAAGENTAHGSAATSTLPVWVIQNREVLRSAIESWREGQRQSGIEENIEIDEESAVLLAEKGVASIGAFNGDWVSQDQYRRGEVVC